MLLASFSSSPFLLSSITIAAYDPAAATFAPSLPPPLLPATTISCFLSCLPLLFLASYPRKPVVAASVFVAASVYLGPFVMCFK